MVSSKLHWLSVHWDDLLLMHPHQWVAIGDQERLWIGSSRSDVKQRAIGAGCAKPLIVYVSEDLWNTR